MLGHFQVYFPQELAHAAGTALEQRLGVTLNVSDECHYIGALGAALFALDHIRTSRSPHNKETTP